MTILLHVFKLLLVASMTYAMAINPYSEKGAIDMYPMTRAVKQNVMDAAYIPSLLSRCTHKSNECAANIDDYFDWWKRERVSVYDLWRKSLVVLLKRLIVVQDVSDTTALLENGRGDEITYAQLPKIPIRRKHLMADMANLMNQFANTMIVLQHFVARRALSFRPTREHYQEEFQIVHLHTEADLPLWNMYGLFMQELGIHLDNILIIFPIRSGVWEMVVKKTLLPHLRKVALFDGLAPVRYEEQHQLPKGIVARASQVHANVPPVNRFAALVYIALLQDYPWHHVMKDVAESFALQHPMGAIVGGWLCDFGIPYKI
ncbi:MAG: hypothetical protein LQ345_005942 [Seirophora villosa]|nr:MAG: hypothetical protein LQ345_005942 [Seirophora villosa]